ncbi:MULTISPECIES: alcohol dehydrogenase catalytic domain-containing protein [unclassified Methylobacterium]|uniref:alcohol dehydrogenase catalytic domain-containing protein n=1 Tax=unclassified Methylobacterium TaxID=2615210 RepID=UPI001F35FDE2|nr:MULTISPECIES: alcohol dehydrogenase catalytic domain-containing protein [Methylobacterium]WFT81745.1 alcohol dehydrogenase catalytic domain-containing protein [Methylobacterium nodulans]
MQVTTSGTLDEVERTTPEPGAGPVLIAVQACGICGADAAAIADAHPTPRPPRVPGHEGAGRIVAPGDGVPTLWKPGQRVGVGRLGGHCNAWPNAAEGCFSSAGTSPSWAPPAMAAMPRWCLRAPRVSSRSRTH